MINKYSVLIGLEKTLLRLIIVAGPLLLELLPVDIMNLTLSGVILFGINYAKNRNKEEVKDTADKSKR